MSVVSLVHVDSLSCEPIVRRSPDGSLLLLCQCGGTEEPSPYNRVLVFHSNDDGKSWSNGEDILPSDSRALYQTEVFISGKTIYTFMTAHNGRFCQNENFILKSKDGGYTWEKEKFFNGLPEFTFIRGGITCGSKVIFPYHGFAVSKEEQDILAGQNKYIWESSLSNMECGVVVCENGKYEVYKSFVLPVFRNDKRRWAWFEPSIVELSNGQIVMLVRIDGTGFLWETRSNDYGKSWSQLEKTTIISPNNKPKLLKKSDGSIVLIHTPNDKIGLKYRYPLELWTSNDNMISWQKKTVSTFPGWYSYPDGFISENGELLFAIDFNRHDVYFFSFSLDKKEE